MIRQLLLGLACTLALASPGMAQEFRRGDVDVDGHLVPIVDAAFLFYWQFSASAPSPQCMDAADANDDGAVNVADSIYLLSLGFIGGPGLPLDPDCSVDSTPDALSCASYPNCIVPPPPAADPNYELCATDASGDPGDIVDVTITLDNIGNVRGFSFGQCYDEIALDLIEVVTGADLAVAGPDGAEPDFVQVTEVTGGWTVGVEMSFLNMSTLPAGVDQELFVSSYQLIGAGASSIDFCDTIGNPAVPIAIVPQSPDWVVPLTDSATVVSSGALIPINDDCVDAIAIGRGSTTFTLVNATTDGPDLSGFCEFGPTGDEIAHQDVWYCYTATEDGLATFGTAGSGLDTRLAVYSGCSCPADPAMVLGCDDDGLGFPPGESRVDVNVVAGESYLVQVGTFSEATLTGSGNLSIEIDPMLPPSNDDCSDAIVINHGITNFSLENATTDGPDLAGFCDPGPSGDDIVHKDVWFIYTANCDGDLTVSTAGTELDTRLAVYSDTICPVDPTSVVACDDDALGFPPGESSVTFPVLAGDTFLIQVGTFSETTGTGPGMLTVECDGIVVSDLFRRGDANDDSVVNVADTIFLLSALFTFGPLPLCSDAGDVNDDEKIDLADPVSILAYLFSTGWPAPPAPGPQFCGPDPTDTGFGCGLYSSCP